MVGGIRQSEVYQGLRVLVNVDLPDFTNLGMD